MTENPLSKDSQAARSPGGWGPCRFCDSGVRLRECRCRGAIGFANAKKGKRKQKVAAKGLGAKRVRHHEEDQRLLVRYESKAGKRWNPVGNAYRKLREQADQARAVGDPRTFVGFVAPENHPGKGIYLVPWEARKDFARAVLAGGDE